MRPSEFVPWEGELLLGYAGSMDGPTPPPRPVEPLPHADVGWEVPLFDLGGEA